MGLLGFVFLQTEAAAEGGLDLVDILLHASLPVQLVIAVLVVMSLICWVIIFAKFFMLKAAEAKNSRFLSAFWGDDSPHWDASRLEDVYGKVGIMTGSPIAAVFKSGYVELAKISGAENSPRHGGELENVTRSLKRSAGTELNRMESMVPFLATTGSTAPFIGLFGTVWGIMETFMAMKGADKSIDAVVGPIAEALIATAIGLAAAIPAVMAYNYFVRKLRTQEIDIDAFESDFLNIVRRYFLRN